MRPSQLLAGLLATAAGAFPTDEAVGQKIGSTYGRGYRNCEKLHAVPYHADVIGTEFGRRYTAAKFDDGTIYRYVHRRPDHGKPYLLFLHGYPSSSYDWRHQITYFSQQGYGLIVPDLLGYGGTSKPEAVSEYRTRNIAEQVTKLLDCERIKTVYAISHDFGSPVLSRLAQFFPDRISAYTFIDIGYAGPGSDLNRVAVEVINRNVSAVLGYPPFGYFPFVADRNSVPLLDSRRDSAFSLGYTGDYTTLWPTEFCPYGAFEAWLKADRRAPIAAWLSEEEQKVHAAIFSHDGYGATTKWHTAMYEGLNAQDDPDIPTGQAQLNKPVLLITATKDAVGLASLAEGGTRPYAPDLRVKPVEAGHWVQLEKKDETNAILEEFFLEVSRTKNEKDKRE